MKSYIHECQSNSSYRGGGSRHATGIYSSAQVGEALPIHRFVADGIEQFDPAISVKPIQATGPIRILAKTRAVESNAPDRFRQSDFLPARVGGRNPINRDKPAKLNFQFARSHSSDLRSSNTKITVGFKKHKQSL